MYMIQYIYTWNLHYFLHVCKAKDQGSLEQLLLRNAVFDLRFEAGGNGMTREALVLCLTIGKNAASIARQKKKKKKTEGTERATKDPPAVRDFHLSRTHCLPGEAKGRAWKSDIGSFVRDNQIAQRSFPTHWAAAIGGESAAYIAYL